MLRKLIRIILWTLAAIILLVIAAVGALYIPGVQQWAKNLAISKVNQSTGMTIGLERLRLRWPLSVELNGVSVIEAGGDTMLTAKAVTADVRLLPLLRGDIDVKGASLRDAFYQMGNADSLMWLRVNASRADISGADINLGAGRIALDRADLDGADVSLVMMDSVAPEPEPTAPGAPVTVTARVINLSRVRYRMRMMPVIDSLDATVPSARLYNGLVSTGRRHIEADSLMVDSVSAIYLTPSADYLAAHPVHAATDSVALTADSLMWDIHALRVGLTGRRAVYAMRGVTPAPGLDMQWLEATDIDIRVDSFYNRGTAIRVPLRRLAATERCGIRLLADGLFTMDSALMQARDFRISTEFSSLTLNAAMGMGDLAANPSLPLSLIADARIATADVAMAFPAAAGLLGGLPKSGPLMLKADIGGTSGAIDVRTLTATYPRLMSLRASGRVADPMNPARINGSVTIDGSLTGLNAVKPTLLEARMARMISLPPMTLRGRVDYRPGIIDGSLALTAAGGRVAATGGWRQKAEGYEAQLTVDSLDVARFLPTLGVGVVDASLHAEGHGLDFMKPTTEASLHAQIDRAVYQGREYSGVTADATLANGNATGSIVSNNPDAELDADFSATLSPELYTWQLTADLHHLDLQAMKLSPTPNGGSLTLATEGSASPDLSRLNATVTLTDAEWTLDVDRLNIDRAELAVNASDSLTEARLTSGDLRAYFAAICGIDSLTAGISRFSAALDTALATRNADIRAIQRTLPPMDLSLYAGQSNFLTQMLRASGTGWQSASAHLRNDSLINFDLSARRLTIGSTRLDTVRLGAVQHGKFLAFSASVNNRPGTLDQFAHVMLNGYLADDKIGLLLRQRDIQGRQGFFLGMNLTMADSLATLRFVPYSPTVGYRKWTLNPDNFLSYNFATRHVDANLAMHSDKSFIKIFTEHPDAPADSMTAHSQEDIIVQLSDIHLSEWLSISPFAPPVKGDLGADMRFHWDASQLTGTGTLSLSDLYYGRDRVGSFDVGVDVTTGRSGVLRADASLLVDSVKVITATGVLNDTTAPHPMMLDFSMIHLPLRIVNPFLPADMARLTGTLNGQMDITGTMASPVFNGFLDFDSTAVNVGMIGTSFAFSEEKIPVDSSVVRFDGFTISGTNDNPLRVNGTVDFRKFTDMKFDLHLDAEDMQIVNSSRPRRNASVYGKANISLDADVRGNTSLLGIDARLSLLAGTNVTYIVTSAESAISSRSTGEMVKFVSFADTAQVLEADSITRSAMAMILNAQLTVEQGSTINVDLSTDGKNRAVIQGQGKLDYSLNPMNDGRLTGRFNINSGYVRYTPPMMSEKKFNFTEGSYVAFNGDMLNPILNIHAVDRMKANVTQTGQNSRLIDFDVMLDVTNTLADMNVAFDLKTNGDITVENELASMTPTQRANQAMNLLLYNTYTGPGTKANSSLNGNPLYSFLASQLNSWAASNIRGVDITFGINQYDKTLDGSTSSTTSYSYQVSKTLFNDRIKIIVGGNYSTDANADENFSQNLINDIAFEYMLNRSGSMYVRIFRHTGYESILEGEITQTGVGFVLRRKINHMRDLFRWAGRLKRSVLGNGRTDTTPTATPTAPAEAGNTDNHPAS